MHQIFQNRTALIDWARETGKTHGFLILIKKFDNRRSGKNGRIFLSCERSGTYSRKRKNMTAFGKSEEEIRRVQEQRNVVVPFY